MRNLRPALVCLLALVALVGAADTVHAQTFNPLITTCLDNAATADPAPFVPGDPQECDGDASAGAATDVTSTFDLPQGDVNVAAAVFFLPPAWGITPGGQVPTGAIVGQVAARATVGLINSPCNNQLTLQFTMLNASIDRTQTVSFEDTDNNGIGDAFEDKDQTGLQDALERYPAFIDRVLGGSQPIRRSAGIEILAGVNVLLQFLTFPPGTPLIGGIPGGASLGYPTVALLQNTGDPEAVPQPNPITDFCSPLTASIVTFGVSRDNPCTDAQPTKQLDPLCEAKSATLEIPAPGVGVSDPNESGHTLFRNPAAQGSYSFVAMALGQRDADGDGYENSFDTCPFVANQGNPRIRRDGDFDEDGLDVACDPNDAEAKPDQDADVYLNRDDNCPLVTNGEQQDNQEDGDGDRIGDACDPVPDVPDGAVPLALASSSVSIGPAATPAPGDCTGDGKTNVVDVLRLLRRVGDPPVALTCGSGDCTGDGGDANIVDVLRLLRRIRDPSVALAC